VESAGELADGFPADELTLFSYDALMIGSFEAAALSAEQHDMIRDFVSRRGGSLLMLGGRRGLADGRWGATSVAEALPARLPALDGPSFTRAPAKALLTDDGARSAVLRLASDDAANALAWEELPDIADWQQLAERKPGAVTLLELQAEGARWPLLVQQRYGLGNAYILATGGTWRWQMQLPHEDQRHETFWRQLLQTLATTAPQRVTLSADRVFYGDQSEVRLRADVKDKHFNAAPDAAVTVDVSDGTGPPLPIEMTPVPGQRGVFEAVYDTGHTGVFRFEATARAGDETLGSARFAVRREDGVVEHFDVQQNRPLLERLAAATKGRYFSLDAVDGLREAVSFSEAGTVERQVLDLWSMPIVFVLLLLLKAAEWLLRLVWGRL
jgi:uncharacterized membrane protein